MRRLFDWEPLWSELELEPAELEELRQLCESRVSPATHGNLKGWIRAWEQLPASGRLRLDENNGAVQVEGEPAEDVATRDTLMEFHPWRKGPFQFMGIPIDTEWCSDLKWDRLRPAVDFRGKKILDVGCGNGYYGWQMLAAGAASVLGCEPFLLYLMQFEIFRRYAKEPFRHVVLPITDAEIPPGLDEFDLALTMGVLYHRTSPIDHLRKMASALKVGGELVLETLVIEGSEPEVLVPEGRYAKMRNVWFIPTVSMLQRWLRRTGFGKVQVVDVSRTQVSEQRRTAWMTFESLADFLSPGDPDQTIEGYPAPCRAMLTARRVR